MRAPKVQACTWSVLGVSLKVTVEAGVGWQSPTRRGLQGDLGIGRGGVTPSNGVLEGIDRI